MRKVFFLLVCFGFVVTINAQTKGFEERSKFGVAVNAIYNYEGVGNEFSGNVQFDIQRVLIDVSIAGLKSDDTGIGLNLGWIFNVLPKLNVYPLAGVLFKDAGDSEFMYNIGAGAQFSLGKGLYLNGRGTVRDAGIGIGIYL